ncbi:MAG: ribosome biogenesis GTPase Der [Gammaproteobacteria bacterium]|nr:MAG: ribosome biogenesis GTPase Der [Gammaproteobacteria bacterium]
MKPVIVLVGRPNVGKSTLFNQLTRSRDALVAEEPGLTRDRQYGEGKLGEKPFLVVDTGGIDIEKEGINAEMRSQAQLAMDEASTVILVTDAHEGLTAIEQDLAEKLRSTGKPFWVAVNKTESLDPDVAVADFYQLSAKGVLPIAAAHRRGVQSLVEQVMEEYPAVEEEEEKEKKIPYIAVVGRPNAGKSTLVNRLLGEERVVVFDQPGTTRDSIFVPLERDDKEYMFIDTAGIRRRGKVSERAEKFSIVKTIQAIDQANVVIVLFDAHREISEQDIRLAGFVANKGRAVIVAVNKWDGLSREKRKEVKKDLLRKLPFLQYARVLFISALHGTAVGDLYPAIDEAYASAMAELATPDLTRAIREAAEKTPPPMVEGRRIKPKFAHQGAKNPPVVVIHGNQVDKLKRPYKRYLENVVRKEFDLWGTPIRIETREQANPFKERNKNAKPTYSRKLRRKIR